MDVWMSRAACSEMAATSPGWPCPRHETPMPARASR
ncbi:Uncharacterised protein [Bordetella pertussis]|nr:Uncharacterised protein [Bordetella pertussis]